MLERLNQLETNIAELEKFKLKYKISEIKSDLQIQWILRYGLFESIQIVIDITCHITTKYNLGNPKTYAECIEILEKEKFLNSNVSEKLLGMIGLRNLLFMNMFPLIWTNYIHCYIIWRILELLLRR